MNVIHTGSLFVVLNFKLIVGSSSTFKGLELIGVCSSPTSASSNSELVEKVCWGIQTGFAACLEMNAHVLVLSFCEEIMLLFNCVS